MTAKWPHSAQQRSVANTHGPLFLWPWLRRSAPKSQPTVGGKKCRTVLELWQDFVFVFAQPRQQTVHPLKHATQTPPPFTRLLFRMSIPSPSPTPTALRTNTDHMFTQKCSVSAEEGGPSVYVVVPHPHSMGFHDHTLLPGLLWCRHSIQRLWRPTPPFNPEAKAAYPAIQSRG